MDIKLKNNNWGIILGILVVVGAALGVMAMYPWLRTQLFKDALAVTESMVENDSYNSYMVDGYIARVGGQLYVFENYWWINGMVTWFMIGLTAFTSIAAFIIGLLRPFNMAGKKVFKAPFEVVALVAVCGISFIGVNIFEVRDFVVYSVIGELGNEFMEYFHMSPGPADVLSFIINFVCWLFFAMLIYWAVTCLTAVFTLGPLRYLKERTITGRLARWCVRLYKKTYNVMETIDFRDKSTRSLLKLVVVNFVLLTVISFFWFFGIFGMFVYSVVLFFVLRKNYFKMQEHYQVLLKATNELAEGNLDVEIREELGVFEPFRDEIKKIQSGFKRAVEEEVKSQSMRTELITNVSHDLKTPLTAIITYINLLKKEDITEEEKNSYIEVLDQKSMRLKSLIEDLFEVSKANSRNMTLNPVEVDIVSLMKQVRLELDDKFQESGVEFKWNLPEKKLALQLDSEKTYRVFENLLVNILKYAMPGTRAYVDMTESDNEVQISMKNISATEISLNGAEISERFVRGDSSRNTEGSGLGLAIAKSFVELQKGKFEVEIEADLFKVLLIWRKTEEQPA